MKTNHTHAALAQRLARLVVPADRYKADLELHDRSQQFSGELLKLALAGIAVVGFLLAHFPKEQLDQTLKTGGFRWPLSASVVAFALSVAFALLHRFYATGANFHHLQAIKLLMLDDASLEKQVEDNLRIRTAKFMVCHRFLQAAAWFLVFAAALLAAAFIRLMFT